MLLGDDVTLPPASESIIFANVMFRGWIDRTDESQWATAPRQISPGVSVARALIPSRATDVPVRVFNVNAQPVRLVAGTIVSQLDQVDVCNVIVRDVSDSAEAERFGVIKRIVDRVDPDVTDHDRKKLTALLLEFSAAFSLSKNKLG